MTERVQLAMDASVRLSTARDVVEACLLAPYFILPPLKSSLTPSSSWKRGKRTILAGKISTDIMEGVFHYIKCDVDQILVPDMNKVKSHWCLCSYACLPRALYYIHNLVALGCQGQRCSREVMLLEKTTEIALNGFFSS